MNKLGLTESGEHVLIEELEELREVEANWQSLASSDGKIEQRSNGQLLYIAVWRAIESLKKENEEMLKRLEAKKHVGSKHIHTDGQRKPQGA